ncbi:MAG: signal peptide peptidase SppA [Proteobacteria bacterium]|nr:signal peptide peptidase SppA [Pseudomonadota bacterium]
MKKKRIFIAILVIIVLVVVITLADNYLGGGYGKAVSGDKIGVVEITGVIKSSDEVVKQLSEFGRDKKIKAIIVRIDSPGGAVAPSQEIYREIMKVRKEKPVIASIGTLGASGGYYIASAATKIVASEGSITGSIGVIIQFFNFQQLLGKIGVKGNVIKSGEYKDSGSPIRDMTKEERELIQGVIDDVHNQFVEAIVKGRGLKKDEVLKIADGRIITGRYAKELKLVDELGNLSDSVELAKRIAKIEGEPKLIYPKKKKIGFLEILNGLSENDASSKLYLLLSDIRIPFFMSDIINKLANEQ